MATYILNLYGIRVDKKSIMEVDRQPIYEYQKRYDTKTGEVTHEEKVLVHEGSYKFRINNLEGETVFDLMEKVKNTYGIKTVFDFEHGCIYLGYVIGNYEDGRDIIGSFGEVKLKQLQDMHKNLKKFFPHSVKDIKLFLIKLKR